MKKTLELAIKSNGLETDIRNIIFHLIRSSGKAEPGGKMLSNGPQNDPFNYLRRSGSQWERRVRKSLNAMCTELNIPMQGQIRCPNDREEFLNKWDELSNYQIDLSNYRPVYAPKDLLEVLLSLKGPQKQEEEDLLPKWEFSHIGLPVKNFFELRTHFAELFRNELNMNDWTVQCRKVLKSRHAPLCQQILKKGLTPPPFRGSLWSYVLGSHVNEHVSSYNKSTILICYNLTN